MTAGCASAPGRLLEPKAVFGLELAPYATTEECIVNAVIMPISRDATTSESGDFAADRKEVYCLMWEAGAGGSVLDYRIGPWPRQQ